MPLPSRAPRRRALVGSAVAIGQRSERNRAHTERQTMAWQERALRVIDLVPELDYVSRFYAKMLSPLRLFPARLGDNGQAEEIKTGPPVDTLARIQDPGGGQSQLLSAYGRLMFITGESNLFGFDLGEKDERWMFVWNKELRVERDKDNAIKKITWTPTPSTTREFGPEEAVVYKFWSPHPRQSGEASSPLRAIVEGDVAEELIALTRSVMSTATTRATRGILIIPQEIQPPAVGVEGDEDPEENTWLSMLAEHFEAQIEQAGSPAAATPYLMDPPYEFADRIRLVETHNPQHDYLERDLRKEAVERVARGVDFPAEALTGIGQTNHWAALQILMDMWRSHGAPMARQLCSDLTTVYYQPALQDAEYSGWEETFVAFDATEITAKPDRSDDVKAAIREMAIGPKGMRSLLGISEEHAPTPEELELMLKFRGRQQPAQASESRDSAADGPEEPGPEGDSGRRTRVTASDDRKMGVIELAVMRCRELAGIRIHQRAQRRYPEHFAFVENLPFADVASSVGEQLVKEMGLGSAIVLVTGGADNLRSLLEVWGYTKEQANIFAELVEMHAANTLFEPGFPSLSEHLVLMSHGLEEAA